MISLTLAYTRSDLDSYEYPVQSYSDLAFRIYGSGARYLVLGFQSVQMLLNVSIILISNGESLSQASRFRLCYAVCVVFWAIVGFLLGQIRTLQKFGFLANFAIWINLLIMFITMGVAANSPPLYSAYSASAGYSVNPALVMPNDAGDFPPVTHSTGLPGGSNFGASINGLMNAVYAYSGTQIFIEFLAEMSRPQNFLKSMWSSQFFIYSCYMVYGLFMYNFQGQYVQNPSYLGISPYTWSTVGNALAMVTALIAAALYGNIGLKGELSPGCVPVNLQLTRRQSSTTASESNCSTHRRSTPGQASGSGPLSFQFTGPLHTSLEEPYLPSLALSVSSQPFAQCSLLTHSPHFYTWAL